LQTLPTLVIAFFDDLFSRQMRPEETVSLPAMNFLFLLGVLWAFVALRDLVAKRAFIVVGLVAIIPFTMVFGIMPATWITHTPFIGNIIHISNTLSCPLIILAAVLAGFGFEIFFKQLGTPAWKGDFVLFLVFLAGLLVMYLSVTQTTPKSGFFVGYAWSMTLAVVALPLGLHLAKKEIDGSLFAAVLLSGVVLLTWRHSQYLRTRFDDYVFNPGQRVNLHPESPAVSFVNAQMKEPSRPIGFGLNLFPGYNQMLGWESILGVDPLRNRYHDELAAALGIGRVRNADTPIVDEGHTPEIQPGLDLMNVRYYLASHTSAPRDIPGLTRLGQFDLDVYESETAWPRAFFTDRLWLYESPDQLAAKIKGGDRQPLAAASIRDRTLPSGAELMAHDLEGRKSQPASRYHLTNNTTSFEVEAASAGVIVLSESYYPDEFRAIVNGEPHDYFRVNHAYKGIYVEAPGTYRVEFVYWPHGLTLALILTAVGTAAIGTAIWWSLLRPRAHRRRPMNRAVTQVPGVG